jgi:hypothetical protein
MNSASSPLDLYSVVSLELLTNQMSSQAQVDILESFRAIDGAIEVALNSPSLDYPVIEMELKVAV